MEELTEVITAAEFHPNQCNTFVYSSSKGTIRLCDMRASALCDQHSKSRCSCFTWTLRGILQKLLSKAQSHFYPLPLPLTPSKRGGGVRDRNGIGPKATYNKNSCRKKDEQYSAVGTGRMFIEPSAMH